MANAARTLVEAEAILQAAIAEAHSDSFLAFLARYGFKKDEHGFWHLGRNHLVDVSNKGDVTVVCFDGEKIEWRSVFSASTPKGFVEIFIQGAVPRVIGVPR